ncbi:hypothetical protein [uncultured Aliiroseovarius sp.]|uniref:hypothetical protein n=1 Tax=uncultured Aliiroseovarius sp. TaxID=1658783 RepID=UPI002593E054|nr:hypothetical protein [uncultured Aliiroseovarius sp.]
MSWLSALSVVEKVFAGLLLTAILAILRRVYLSVFKRPTVHWAKVADIAIHLEDGTSALASRQFGQRYYIRNNSAKRVEEVELWFQKRPKSFVFDPNVRYGEEESNGKYVVTLRSVEGKQSVFLDLQTDTYGLLERAVESGEEGKQMLNYKPVDPKAVVLPSLADMGFYMLLAFALIGPFAIAFLENLQKNASGVSQ